VCILHSSKCSLCWTASDVRQALPALQAHAVTKANRACTATKNSKVSMQTEGRLTLLTTETLAPAFNNAVTVLFDPRNAANIKAVSPRSEVALISAPFSMRMSAVPQ